MKVHFFSPWAGLKERIWRALCVGICRQRPVRPGPGPRITLYSRQGCCLCEEMELLLEPFLQSRAVQFRRLEVDRSPCLAKRYGHRVPVLFVNGEILAEGRFPVLDLARRLEKVL